MPRPKAKGHHRRGPFGGPPGNQPPPWWPEGEPWPPQGPGPGGAIGRRFAILAIGIFILVCLALAIINHVGENWGPPEGEGPPGPFFWPPIALLLIGGLVFFLVRKIVRAFRPLAQVIDAADRVAQGDYSARVTTRSPRESRGVVAAFNTMAERLQANEEQRQRLLSDVTHELRTPLAIVQGTIEGMLDDVYPADREHLEPLLERTRSMGHLLNDLQVLANTEAGAISLHMADTDPGDLIRDVATAYNAVAATRGVNIAAEPTQTPTVHIDPFRMQQVLDNLVSNSLRYTPEGGTITLRTSHLANDVLIHVEDTGCGMSEEAASRMFERFEKSADSGGSGLGLAIARGLVMAHGGTISATSQPGEGTAVTIRLPLATL
jgi:two-component system sensor histidine kinase BaeS